ncbi:MAG: glycosyltransferase family 4 protein [Candidatus Eremiobacteraeota bacterium]|nr:glycosyltransferase family 4 protein [Candidatus Eremiobacteraeota bacterium]
MSARRVDVALDTRATSHMSLGMIQYARELAQRLPRVAPDLRFETFGRGDNFDAREQLGIPLRLAAMRPRLAHFLAPYAPLAVPVPYVVTIHDLIDLRYPQWVKPKARFYHHVVLRRIARAARAVVTDDARTAGDLVRFFALARDRIAIIPLGVDLPSVPTPPPRRRPYIIYAGNHRPHKDLTTLAEGWRRVDPSLELDLVLTGERDAAIPRVSRSNGELIFLGRCEHAALMSWIAGASALVHPALLEGFGLPLLEAARLGTPAIASDSAVPEVLRPHVRTFATGDADGLARAVEAALRGEQKESAEEARTATASLTWDACARATAALYRRLL